MRNIIVMELVEFPNEVINVDKVKEVQDNLKMVLKHWGFGEICSSMYAVLALSNESLTAKELSDRIGYAYTTTINALNHSMGLGHIKKMRQGGRYVYYIDADLADIIKEKLDQFLDILEKTENSIQQLDKNLKRKLKTSLKTVDDAIKFLRNMKKVRAKS